jgi:hypothetical protein
MIVFDILLTIGASVVLWLAFISGQYYENKMLRRNVRVRD